MSLTLQSMSVERQVEELKDMSTALVEIVTSAGGAMDLYEALNAAARRCGVPPSQMHYALTYAKAERLLKTDSLTARLLLP